MNHSRNFRQLPLAPFPRQSAPRLNDRVEKALRPRRCRFLVMPTGSGFVQVSLNKR